MAILEVKNLRKSFGKTEMKIQIENKIIELHIQNYEI